MFAVFKFSPYIFGFASEFKGFLVFFFCRVSCHFKTFNNPFKSGIIVRQLFFSNGYQVFVQTQFFRNRKGVRAPRHTYYKSICRF